MASKKQKVKVGDLVVQVDDLSRTLLVTEIKGEKAKVAPFFQGSPARRLSAWLLLQDLQKVAT